MEAYQRQLLDARLEKRMKVWRAPSGQCTQQCFTHAAIRLSLLLAGAMLCTYIWPHLLLVPQRREEERQRGERDEERLRRIKSKIMEDDKAKAGQSTSAIEAADVEEI